MRTAKPAEFMQAISRSSWKYFNLTVDLGKEFLKRYESKGLKNAMVVMKTKDNKALSDHGLLPNSCAYELIDFKKTKLNRHIMIIRSTIRNQQVKGMNFKDK